MNGERWEPSSGVRAYQSVRAFAPIILAGEGTALLKKAGIHIGSNYTSATHTQRFLAAQSAGNDSTARALIDQAFGHAFQESIPDQAMWQGIWQAMRAGANAQYGAYMDGLTGGQIKNTAGVIPPSKGQPAGSSGGILDTISSWVDKVTKGPSENVGMAAGAAAGEKVKGTILLVGVVLAIGLVVAAVYARRR